MHHAHREFLEQGAILRRRQALELAGRLRREFLGPTPRVVQRTALCNSARNAPRLWLPGAFRRARTRAACSAGAVASAG